MSTSGQVTSLNVVLLLGGKEVAKTDVHDFLIEMDLDQPDMCAVSLSNETARHSETVREGDDMELKLGTGNGTSDVKTVFSGEVVGLEPIFEVRQPARVTVRGFNALHSLARGKKSVAFLNASDKDIVERICREYSFAVDFGSSPPTAKYEHVYQHNQTDLEFLRLRAARIGYELRVEEKKLFFCKRSNEDSQLQMSLFVPSGDAKCVQLERFFPRLSTANQVSEVRVRGWNPSKKSEIIGVAKPTRSSLGDKTGTQAAEQRHRGVLDVDVDIPVYSREEADALAKAILNERLMSFITGDGSCHGHPDLKPGLVVSIDLGGGNNDGYRRFSGRYHLTAVRHRYRDRRQSAGYETDFRFRRDAENEC